MTDVVSNLEALFEVVLDEARTRPSFARKLAASIKAVGDPGSASSGSKPEAPNVDFRQIYLNEGEEAARLRLRSHTQKNVYAWLKASGLSSRNASKMNKTQLVDHILRVLKTENGNGGRRFEY